MISMTIAVNSVVRLEEPLWVNEIDMLPAGSLIRCFDVKKTSICVGALLERRLLEWGMQEVDFKYYVSPVNDTEVMAREVVPRPLIEFRRGRYYKVIEEIVTDDVQVPKGVILLCKRSGVLPSFTGAFHDVEMTKNLASQYLSSALPIKDSPAFDKVRVIVRVMNKRHGFSNELRKGSVSFESHKISVNGSVSSKSGCKHYEAINAYLIGILKSEGLSSALIQHIQREIGLIDAYVVFHESYKGFIRFKDYLTLLHKSR